MRRHLTGLLVLAGLLAPASASAQNFRGLVTDAVTAEPISLATVTLISETGERVGSVLTTDEGFFSLDGDGAGRFLVRATALGYAPARAGPFEAESDGVQVVELPMRPAPVGIEGVLVEGERQGDVGNYLTQKGFWERYEEGRGEYLTPGEVLASDAMFTPHLLRQMKHIVPQYGAAPWSVWPVLGVTEQRACEPRIYVDDVWVNREDFGIRETVGLDDVVPIDRVLAVELYYGPFQAPLRYQGTTAEITVDSTMPTMGKGANSCGVILIWTR